VRPAHRASGHVDERRGHLDVGQQALNVQPVVAPQLSARLGVEGDQADRAVVCWWLLRHLEVRYEVGEVVIDAVLRKENRNLKDNDNSI
jgi:hypothetical protein